MTITKTTLELAHGDVVDSHGMRVLLDAADRETYTRGDREVVSWPGRILNLAEVRERGFIPPSFMESGTWRIQGNDLARWAVDEIATDLVRRYSTERSAAGRDAILTEAIEAYGASFEDGLVERFGAPDKIAH